MKNVSKHSIKCNKRDKLELISIMYEVYYSASKYCCQVLFRSNTKFDCLEWLSFTNFENKDKCCIRKVVTSKVIS